jgi:hypothetical protein
MQGHIAASLYFLAEQNGEPAGVVRFQLEDQLFWPENPPGEAAYLHRFAVRRKFAGGGMARELQHLALGDHTRGNGASTPLHFSLLWSGPRIARRVIHGGQWVQIMSSIKSHSRANQPRSRLWRST